MKKVLALITALAMLLTAFVGCAPTAEETTPQTQPTKAPAAATPGNVFETDEPFVIAWVSDPQWYSFKYFDMLTSQNEWIVDNFERLNMKYIVHTGDFVNLPHERKEWDSVTKEYAKWDKAGLPYGVLAGNHDVDGHDHTEYSEYFGEARYNKNPWYGGSYEDNFGHYDLLTIGGVEFIFAYLGYNYTEEDLAWLDGALAKHSDRIAVLAFHDYLTISGVRSDAGEKAFNDIVLKHPNVRMVLCGHNYLATRRVDDIDDDGDGKSDRSVYQMMANYQNLENGGNAFFRLMTFDVKNGIIDNKTYSPKLDTYNAFENSEANRDEYGYQDEFVLPFDFSKPQSKSANAPEKGTVVQNSRVSFAATDKADAFVVPVSYLNEIEEGDTFNNAGMYDRTFSLSATDAFGDPKNLNYITMRYTSKEGYRVESVIKGADLADDAVVPIPYDGSVMAIASDAVDQKGNPVDVDAIEEGQIVTLNQMNGFAEPLTRRFTIMLTCPWGTTYGVHNTNRMIGSDQWLILDSTVGDSAADTGDTHEWNMLFAFSPTGNDGEYTLTDTATASGEQKDLAIPENGFVLVMNTYSGKHSLGDSIREHFVVGMTVTMKGYKVK